MLIDEIIAQLRSELGPSMNHAAAQVARQAAQVEVEQTRRWFEGRALPKAVRVAQKESYDVLRKYGLIGKTIAHSEVGRRSAAPTASFPVAASVGSAARGDVTGAPIRAAPIGFPATDAALGGPSSPRLKSTREIRESAESCVALLEMQGKSVDATLDELSRRAGSWLGKEDLERIGETARQLLRDQGRKQC